MRKFLAQTVAGAVAIVLASTAAHAQLASPAQGSSDPYDGGAADGLFLAVWNDGTNVTDLIDLSYVFSQIQYPLGGGGSSQLTTVAGEPFTSATNPATGVGMVDQLNFGPLSNYNATITLSSGAVTTLQSALFGSGNIGSTQYLVGAANGGLHTGVDVTYAPGQTYGGNISTPASALASEAAAWDTQSGGAAPYIDTSGSPASAIGADGSIGDGSLGTGFNFAGLVGNPLAFWQFSKNGTKATQQNILFSPDGTAADEGFWFLSDTGDLSWNLPEATAPVPLPPAVWLFASGLVGLGAIGRRRRSRTAAV